MATDHNVQLVFQGGGAKLVVLIAAAKAAYDAQKDGDLNLRIKRISGTSAGALAGCMLATGKDPELFRQYLIGHASAELAKIEREIGWVRSPFSIFRGVTLYHDKNYRAFLQKMFLDVAGVQHMRELPIDCLFHATDIRNGKPKLFDGSQEDHTIVEALFCSSSLPFIFGSYRGSPYVDGGLINNFPSDSLAANQNLVM